MFRLPEVQVRAAAFQFERTICLPGRRFALKKANRLLVYSTELEKKQMLGARLGAAK